MSRTVEYPVVATQLTEGLWRVDCRTLDKPNVYIIEDGEYTLVDAGHLGDVETVLAGLDDAGIGAADIDRVLLTHYDADHVGTLAALTPNLDAPVYIHPEDAPYVAGDRLPPWTARNGIEIINRLLYRRLDLPDLPIRMVHDEDSIGSFRAYHTPGHTPGHMVYVHDRLEAVFLGDLAYTFANRLRPSGRLSSYDSQQVTSSIRHVLDQVPEFEYACPGHGPPLTDGYRHLARTLE